jgi:hypothetical protein
VNKHILKQVENLSKSNTRNLTFSLNNVKNVLKIDMGRITVELPDELEKKLRFKTIEKFGGKKGDLSRAVEEAVKTWVAKGK